MVINLQWHLHEALYSTIKTNKSERYKTSQPETCVKSESNDKCCTDLMISACYYYYNNDTRP